MALQSKLFRGTPALEACLISDAAHVLEGARGSHVQQIQRALVSLDGLLIDGNEIADGLYGRSTSAAVLAYKRERHIVNPSYQTKEDSIVGKMTIASLDKEMALAERRPPLRGCVTDLGGGTSSALVRGSVSSTQLEFSPGRVNLAFQFAVHPSDVFRGDDIRIALLVERASVLLKPFGLTVSMRVLPSFPFAFTVGERDDIDVLAVRKAAETASPGNPSLLRLIFCHLRNSRSTATSQGKATGAGSFKNFVLMNQDRSHPDNGTVLHEMIHCSDDRFMNDFHDDDQSSVYSRGSNRTVLRDEHARSINASFFRS